MKKLFVIFASIALVAAFAVTASANDWSLYGNARMATFWTDDDPGGTADSDSELQWVLQGNSRVGANVKGDNLKAQFELGLKEDQQAGDKDVGTRRIYGVYDYGAMKLKIGKDYTPVKQFLSGQVFDSDLGLVAGHGAAYGGRRGQISFGFGPFEIALVTPQNSDLGTGGDVDVILPKLEAIFGMKTDVVAFNVFGGFQTYDIESTLTSTNTSDESVDSFALGGDVSFNFGPAYLKFGGSVYNNGGDAGWYTGNASFVGSSVEDTSGIMWLLVGGFKAGDTVTIEGGVGFLEKENDAPGAKPDDNMDIYVQAVLQIAPGVFIIPEVGVQDRGDDGAGVDEGDRTYFGAKWQINF
jgi:hypothetical protein